MPPFLSNSGASIQLRLSEAVSRMMSHMIPIAPRRAARMLQLGLFFLTLGLHSTQVVAQVNYSVHFEMEKTRYLLGEPIFCRFVIRNVGTTVFSFRYRTPTRSLTADYDQEPRFIMSDARGKRLADPAPRPCGSPQGTAVYGFVTLPPGQIHTERWLLNQWAEFAAVGEYHVRAERRLALFRSDPQTGKEKPAAFALAIDELTLPVVRATHAQIEAAFQPYLAAVRNPKDSNPAEAVTVLTSLPQPFFLDQLIAMTNASKPERWSRRDALDGLARLNTPASWKAILDVFRRDVSAAVAGAKDGAKPNEDPLRSYALLLLAEKADPAFIPAFVDTLTKSQEPMRGEVLRALGFFHDARAYEVLFENLHSPQASDRMNAILGLKNAGEIEVIPALLAALDDPEAQVRQVANFALEGVTGHQVAVSANPTREESKHVASDWHAWWRAHAGNFSPPPPTACHEW